MKMRRSSSTAQTSDEMPPYERLLGDALRGDRTLFGSEAGVEAAWVVVNDVLSTNQPLHIYEPGSWGPSEAAGLAASASGWVEPGWRPSTSRP